MSKETLNLPWLQKATIVTQKRLCSAKRPVRHKSTSPRFQLQVRARRARCQLLALFTVEFATRRRVTTSLQPCVVIFFAIGAHCSRNGWPSVLISLDRCITEVVIKSSRCPVCSTPTLLYCLFRLDIYT